MRKIKEFMRNNQALMHILSMIYSLFGLNWLDGIRRLSIKKKCAFLWKTKIVNHGKNNKIIFKTGCRVYNCRIIFGGDNNIVKFDHDCECKDIDIWISDGGYISWA